MNLFSSPHKYSEDVMEATVTNVDPIRFVCSLKTVRGQYFNEVSWLLPVGGAGKNGMHATPSLNDQAVVFTGLGYPIILGFLPRLGVSTSDLTTVTGQPVTIDPGNNTNLKNGYVTNPGKPSDFTVGDQVWTNDSGGVLALLANGTIVAKVSALAQLLISKYDDLIRIVARNWERFSDVGQQTVANVKGRMYEYLGWDRDLHRSKIGLYELQEVFGDVAAGEVLRGEPNLSVAVPEADTRIHKQWLTNPGGQNLMVEVLHSDGKIEVSVFDPATSGNSKLIQDDNLYETSVTNGTFSKVTLTPTSAVVTYNDESTTTHDAGGIRSEFGGHFVRISESGVALG